MIVWRLEDEEGKGPFHNYWATLDHYGSASGHYPSSGCCIRNEAGIAGRFTKDHYCGFKDLEQFQQWFPSHHEILEEAGLKLTRYLVAKKHMLMGDEQVMFIRNEAKKVDRQLPSEIVS